MGHLGRKTAGSRPSTLVQGLTRAYSDEWFAHYNYHFVANTISGPDSPALIELLRRKADRALAHAQRLAGRLAELNEIPVTKLDELSDYATDKSFKLPKNVRDTDGALKAVLDAERTSIRTYSELLRKSGQTDRISGLLFLQLLSEAVAGEQELERLVGRPAPEMDGR